MGLFRRLDPLSVEVGTWQVAAVVSDDDTVDVEHGNDFEDEVLAKHAGCGAVANQEVDYVLYNETWHCLAWVDSGGQYDCFLLLIGGLTDSKIVATMDITKKYLFPDSVKHKNLRWNLFFFTGSISIDRKYLCKCVYV